VWRAKRMRDMTLTLMNEVRLGAETKTPFHAEDVEGSEFVPSSRRQNSSLPSAMPITGRSSGASRRPRPSRVVNPVARGGTGLCAGLTAAGPLPIRTGFPIKLKVSTRNRNGS
jgi:hypothetical protein